MSANYEPGDEIAGRYQVTKLIGAGGMGAVVEVVNQAGDPFALKYCVDSDDQSRRRFSREVRIMAGIRHSHVVRVLDHDLESDPPFFVMPLAKGTLEDELGEMSQDEDMALDAFGQICLGVQAIHNSDAVHRDIKPLNALRLPDGRIVVSDLGLSKFHDRDTTTLTQAGAFLGTRMYCAPEQLLLDGSRDADERTDIFQLGRTLYQLLTGQPPVLIEARRLDPSLHFIIRRATREDPNLRYRNIGEFLDALNIYRRSKDPTNNPHEALEQLIGEADAKLKNKEYDRR